MTYRIAGLSPEPFARYFAMGPDDLASNRARIVVAESDRGSPCRVSLRDASAGERLVLVNHVSLDVETPYRASHAIFVREAALEPAVYEGVVPPVFAGRQIALRGFDHDGMLITARLCAGEEADADIRELFADPRIACIHAHNAAHGCFAARIERVEP